MPDHFRSGAASPPPERRGEPIDARRCTVQLQNGHLYLDAAAAPAQCLLGYDAPRPLGPSATSLVERIERMAPAYRCIALLADRGEAVALAVQRLQEDGGAAVQVVDAAETEADDAARTLIALENDSLGRSGAWLSSPAWRRPPRAIVIGEAMSGGAPFAAVLICSQAAPDRAPVVRCHAETLDRAGAIVETVETEQILAQVPALDRYLRERLNSVRDTSEVAGLDFGALRAAITPPARISGPRLKRRLCERGVLVGLDEHGRIVIAPPLVIRPAEIDVISGALRAALTDRRWRPAPCCPACSSIAAD
jgi:hypothetical protein